jgi:lipoprotein-anchoring transpeptidase ErfK/SrfK
MWEGSMRRRVSGIMAGLGLVAVLSIAGCAPSVPEHVAAEAGEAERIVVVERSDSELYYFEDGECLRVFPVVVGAIDSPTPVGEWRVWKAEELDEGTAYGVRKLSLERLDSKGEWEEGPYAIHGTDEPGLLDEEVPRMFSNGCIRLSNTNVTWLYKRIGEGDEVVVVP